MYSSMVLYVSPSIVTGPPFTISSNWLITLAGTSTTVTVPSSDVSVLVLSLLFTIVVTVSFVSTKCWMYASMVSYVSPLIVNGALPIFSSNWLITLAGTSTTVTVPSSDV